MQVTHRVGRAEETAVRSWALARFELSPLRIAAVYLVLGFAALFVSDVLLVGLVSEPLLAQAQAAKGGVEVLLTGGLIYALSTAHRAQVDVTSERFQRQREELLVLHRVLRHNLRNDLNVIFGHSNSLAESVADDEGRSRCDVIFRKAEDILHYTEQAERIRRVSEGNGTRPVVDLAAKVPEIVEGHPLVTDDVVVGYDLPESAPARVNRMFAEAVEEIVENAIRNNQDGRPTLEISVDADVGPLHQAELRIDDDGPGIPEHVPRILAESEYDQLAHLRGLGIWFVYWVVVESRGELVIEESPMGGASVAMRFPGANAVGSREIVPTTRELLPV